MQSSSHFFSDIDLHSRAAWLPDQHKPAKSPGASMRMGLSRSLAGTFGLLKPATEPFEARVKLEVGSDKWGSPPRPLGRGGLTRVLRAPGGGQPQEAKS